MKFKQRGRTTYLSRENAEGAAAETLGQIREPDFAIDDDLRGKLTPLESVDLDSYVAERRRHASVIRDHAVVTFDATLATVSDWLESADPKEASRFVERTTRPLTKLRRQLATVRMDEE